MHMLKPVLWNLLKDFLNERLTLHVS
jgi:hypothetical protein